MRHSYGALLFTFIDNDLKIVLGKEYGLWHLFAGGRNGWESHSDAASRELYEETRGIVNVSRFSIPVAYQKRNGKQFQIGIGCIPNVRVDRRN